MKEKDVDLWWDVVQNIVQKDIRKVYKKYERNERMYRHMISPMEKVMPSFEYEPLVLSLDLETLDEKKEKGDTNGVGPSSTRVIEQPRNLRGGKDSPKREAVEQALKILKIYYARHQLSRICICNHRNRGANTT